MLKKITAVKKKAQKDGLWGLVTDVLQTVTGAAITAVVLGLTPFTGGLSLGLVALGGMMVVGGVNSGINHFSMAATGKGYNLIGNLTTTAGQWYNSSLGKSLGQDGVGGFVNGFVSGAGEMVSGMGQFSIYDIGTGIHTLATNPEAQQQMLNGFGNYLTQLRSGNAKVYGETAFNIVSLVVGVAEIKSAVSIAKASEVESVFSKIGVFTKALGKASLENGKSLLTMPGRAVDNIGNKLTDIRELFGGKGLNYAFAHAGEGRSVLNVVGKGADDLPRNGVRNSFSKAVGKSKASEVLSSSEAEEMASKIKSGNFKTPAEQAQKWQGKGKYPGIDEFKDNVLKKDEIYYRGEPNGSEFFTTKGAIEEIDCNAQKLFEGLQVEKNPVHGYRGTMQGYKLSEDVDAAGGLAKSNPQFGYGGLPQQFIPNADELIEKGILVPADKITLIK